MNSLHGVERDIWVSSRNVRILEMLSSKINKSSNGFKRDEPDPLLTNKNKGI